MIRYDQYANGDEAGNLERVHHLHDIARPLLDVDVAIGVRVAERTIWPSTDRCRHVAPDRPPPIPTRTDTSMADLTSAMPMKIRVSAALVGASESEEVERDERILPLQRINKAPEFSGAAGVPVEKQKRRLL